jgi:hypothetical protein
MKLPISGMVAAARGPLHIATMAYIGAAGLAGAGIITGVMVTPVREGVQQAIAPAANLVESMVPTVAFAPMFEILPSPGLIQSHPAAPASSPTALPVNVDVSSEPTVEPLATVEPSPTARLREVPAAQAPAPVVVQPTSTPTAVPTTAPTSAPVVTRSEPPATSVPVLPREVVQAPTPSEPQVRMAEVASPTPLPSSVHRTAPTVSDADAPPTHPSQPVRIAASPTPTDEPQAPPAPTSEPALATAVPATAVPSAQPTRVPTSVPTPIPSKEPTVAPTPRPTSAPTKQPTSAPTPVPTSAPKKEPTSVPTSRPTSVPTKAPTPVPTHRPPAVPTPHVPTPVRREVVVPTPIPRTQHGEAIKLPALARPAN